MSYKDVVTDLKEGSLERATTAVNTQGYNTTEARVSLLRDAGKMRANATE